MDDICKLTRLPDGRNLGYYEYGDYRGNPVFYFHGAGAGSGLYAKAYDQAAKQSGIRLIAPDRPGIGLSCYKDNRRLSDWPEDVKRLAGSLGIHTFSILSESGGSVYAFSCVDIIPQCIIKVAVVSGLCPFYIKSITKGLPIKSKIPFSLLKKAPKWLLKKMYSGLLTKIKEDDHTFFSNAIKKSSTVDKEILSDSNYQSVYKESILSVFKQGEKGIVTDLKICSQNWGVDFSKLTTPICFWHGEKDASSPAAMVKRFSSILKNSNTVIYPNDTHASVLQLHTAEVFSSLV